MILSSVYTKLLFVLVLVNVCYQSKYSYFCPKGQFRVANMTECHPILVCSDFGNVEIVKLVGFGAVKWVFLANWGSFLISVSVLRNPRYLNDFQEGLKTLKALSPSKYINQLVGYCETEHLIATEYQSMNNANSLKYILKSNRASVPLSFKLCVNYVDILNFIHNSPIGVRVNCDSDSVEKILSQLLVTDNLNLVLNDVDSLPEVNPNVTITCGKNNRFSSLIPPELVNEDNHVHLQGYTDKSDVWKVPDVCNYILELAGVTYAHYALFSIHKRCKSDNPIFRPSSFELVNLYEETFNSLNGS